MTAVLPSGPMDTSLNTRPGLLTTAIVILWIQGATAVVCGLFGLASGFGGGVYASMVVPDGPVPDAGAAARLVVGLLFAALFATIAVVLMTDAVALARRQPGPYVMLLAVESLVGLVGAPMMMFGTGLIQVLLAVLVMVGVLTKRSRDWLAGEPRPVADERAAPAPPATGLETEPRSQE